MADLNRTGVASLVLLAATFVFAVVLGFILAFGSSEPDPWEERWAELGVPETQFVFLGDFKAAERESIRRELRVAQVVFFEHFGAVSSDFTAYVSTSLDTLNEQWAKHVGDGTAIWFTCGGRATRGAIFLVLRGLPLTPLNMKSSLRTSTSTSSSTKLVSWIHRTYRLSWLHEGSAEYASALVNEAQGRRTLAAVRQGKQLAWSAGLHEGKRYSTSTASLRPMGSWKGQGRKQSWNSSAWAETGLLSNQPLA